MIRRTLSTIITFDKTVEAMAAEAFAREKGVPGRLIPVPTTITAGCGLAWKAQPSEKDLVCEAFSAGGIHWKEAYVLEV